MKVTNVDMYSANVEEPISFSLQGADPDAQYQVRQILGLDAEEIIPKFYGTSLTGKKFFNFSMKPRDIVARVVLKPREIVGETYSSIRDELYRAIASNRTGGVTLQFRSGSSVVSTISGNILKFEVGYFNKLPEVQITIRCQDPMFRAINPVQFGLAELEASNPVTIPDTLSTAPHGFYTEIKFTAVVAQYTLQDAAASPEWQFKVTPSGGFIANDVLYLSSELNNKYVYMIRGGVTTQLADAIMPGSIWPIIFPYPNSNTFYSPVAANVDWRKLEYYAAYWGV